MARARTLKPSFFKNEDLADLPIEARLLFTGLWCLADRDGRLLDRPRTIRVEIMPYDNCDVDSLLNKLQEKKFIVRYLADGQNIIQITNFAKHQNPHPKEASLGLPNQNTTETSAIQPSRENKLQEIYLPEPTGPITLSLLPITSNPISNFPITEIADAKKEKIDSGPFEEFWEQYPKQRIGSKQQAWIAWQKSIRRGILSSEIISGCLAYAASGEVEMGFAKGCAAWLNDERWRNDYSKKTVTNQKPNYSDNMKKAAELAIRGIKDASSG